MLDFSNLKVRKIIDTLLNEGAPGHNLQSKVGQDLLAMLMDIRGVVRKDSRSDKYLLTPVGRKFLLSKTEAPLIDESSLRQQRMQRLGLTFPNMTSRTTAHALWCGNSKCRSKDCLPDSWCTTCDGVVRVKTLEPINIIMHDGYELDVKEHTLHFGEYMLPERAFDTVERVQCGQVKVITVENLGAYSDYSLKPGELVVYVPGSGTNLAKKFIAMLYPHAEWAHFGDLDQRGIDIACDLAKSLGVPARLWLPVDVESYCKEYARSLPNNWEEGKVPWKMDVSDNLCWLQWLVNEKKWLEQEVLVLADNWRFWVLE